ncbi:MAG: hypothetical protein WD638_10370 [Nitriliruptoraceae bacterium]
MAKHIVSVPGSRALVELAPAEIAALLEEVCTGSIPESRCQVGDIAVRYFSGTPPGWACLAEREDLRMNESSAVRAVRYLAAAIAVLFGTATLFAGGRALAGIDPGYQVFLPLLVYNTVMGFSYVAVGLAIWRSPRLGRAGAHTIFMLNVVALITIVFVYSTGGGVAVDSLQAMSFRTAVWMALFLATAWMVRPRADA